MQALRWMMVGVLALLLAGPALAVKPDEVLLDQKMEQRARHLSTELRCMVCQNQSIDDSDAPLARDLRVLVRERLVAGDSDRQVLDYLQGRYGDFVLLRPPVRMGTLLLWITPVLVLGLGAGALVLSLRRRRQVMPAPVPLSADEKKQLDALMGGKNDRLS
jgi:cytochrome c-type biogenesis protein CcmH